MKRSFLLCCLALCIIAAAPLTAQAGSQPAEQTITVNVNVAKYASITASESVGFNSDPSLDFEDATVTILANFNYQVVMSSSNVAPLDAGLLADQKLPVVDYPYAVDGDGNRIFFLPLVYQPRPSLPPLGVAAWAGGPVWASFAETFGGDPGVTAEFGLRVGPITALDAASGLPFEYPLAGSYSGDLILTLVEV